MMGSQLQRLAVPTLRHPFWGRLVLTAAIAVVLLLYLAFRSSGSLGGPKAIFGHRGSAAAFAVSNAARGESRLAGIVHGNPWKRMVGNRRRAPGAFPKVLYVSVKDKENVPWDAQSSIDQCARLNPEYTVEIMGDTERNSTVQQYAPSLLQVYNRLKPTERNDFWSYLVSGHLLQRTHLQYCIQPWQQPGGLCTCTLDVLSTQH